jgi:purine catabolism regulator
MGPAERLTVRELLGLPELVEAVVVGGDSGLAQEVAGVEILSVVDDASTIRSGQMVVVALPGRRPSFELDLVLRRVHHAGAVAALLANVDHTSMSTGRLADSLGMPTIRFATDDAIRSAWALERMIKHPQLPSYELLAGALEAIRQSDGRPDQITSVLRRRLGVRCGVVSTDGELVAGDRFDIDPDLLRRSSGGAFRLGDGWLVVWPVRVEGNGSGSWPDLWFALELPASHRETVRAMERVAALAAMKVELWAVRERLGSERDARTQADVLSELLSSDTVSSSGRERALRVGFRLDGWHTGLYIRAAARPSSRQQLRDLATTLVEELAAGPVVSLHGGWATWLSDRSDPDTRLYRERAGSLRTLIQRASPDGTLIAGIGRPYEGVRGIAESLDEARDAALFASFNSRRGSVQHIDELGHRRILSEWYRSEAFRTHALDLLEPLLGSGEVELARTLGAYLDRESSTSATANHLGVHRNTVFDRVERAQRLLGVQLANADDRLVLQLACRVLGFGAGDQSTTSASSDA